MADSLGIISWVCPSMAATPAGRSPPSPIWSSSAADRARDTLAATGSQIRFHIGSVASIHCARLHAWRSAGPAEKSVTVSSHRSATVIACLAAAASAAEGRGSPAVNACCFAAPSTRPQLTGPLVVLMMKRNWLSTCSRWAGSEYSAGIEEGSKPCARIARAASSPASSPRRLRRKSSNGVPSDSSLMTPA